MLPDSVHYVAAYDTATRGRDARSRAGRRVNGVDAAIGKSDDYDNPLCHLYDIDF